MSKKNSATSVPALKVKQWLTDWDDVGWSEKDRGDEPQHWFYQFSMQAGNLKALSGIYPRTTERQRGAEDLGIQRRHEKDRSEQIRRFVRYGYPWSELSKKKRTSDEFKDLRQPGWLPTAIVVNILTAGDQRLGKKVAKGEFITVNDGTNGVATIQLPNTFSGPDWQYSAIPPLEVIDGQHRLWAFEDAELSGDFELPVVAFVGLDLKWQAYLFYTINIKPKKINASLAFDLYPLLRAQDWLTKFEGHVIYRETRAQELVDLLWSHRESPWYHRINMLGEKGYKGLMVTQAAWVRSLLASVVKSWEGRGVRIGGLFGSSVGKHETVLPWSRAEQAAFLIVAGQAVKEAIGQVQMPWANALRKQKTPTPIEQGDDLAFYGPNSLINQDQGIRTLLQVLNDIMYVRADKLALHEWGGQQGGEGTDEEQVASSAASLRRRKKIAQHLKQLAECLATYDWRSSDAPGLTEEERILKASFRGSGGYKELRRKILEHIVAFKSGDVSTAAEEVLDTLGY
jgi:DGQHR domain-containing protein